MTNWITYSNRGTKIESACWDWACMEKIITDYREELGLTDEEAYTRFWEDVRASDPEDYDSTLEDYTFEEALSYGHLDEARASYLLSLDIKCTQIEIDT